MITTAFCYFDLYVWHESEPVGAIHASTLAMTKQGQRNGAAHLSVLRKNFPHQHVDSGEQSPWSSGTPPPPPGEARFINASRSADRFFLNRSSDSEARFKNLFCQDLSFWKLTALISFISGAAVFLLATVFVWASQWRPQRVWGLNAPEEP